jgi:PilZ domain
MDDNQTLAVNANDSTAIGGDRRLDRRYEIQLDLRWKLIRRRRVLETGTGQTLDLSSGGIHFEADRPLPAGLNIELSIAWPAMLQGSAPLQLVVSGKIVRSVGRKTAIQKSQHEFRTVGSGTEQRAAQSASPRSTASGFLAHSAAFAFLSKVH